MNKLTIETVVKVDPDTIEVTASTAIRDLATDKKIFYRGKDIALLVTEYEILETVEDPVIANTKRGNHKQRATWFFKIKKVTQNKTKAAPKPKENTAPSPTKKPASPKSKPVEAKDTQTKDSTKRSFRGRMSKIAQKKQETNE